MVPPHESSINTETGIQKHGQSNMYTFEQALMPQQWLEKDVVKHLLRS
jgi:hypothetical protein